MNKFIIFLLLAHFHTALFAGPVAKQILDNIETLHSNNDATPLNALKNYRELINTWSTAFAEQITNQYFLAQQLNNRELENKIEIIAQDFNKRFKLLQDLENDILASQSDWEFTQKHNQLIITFTIIEDAFSEALETIKEALNRVHRQTDNNLINTSPIII